MDAQEVMHMTDYSKITALYSRLSVGDEDRDGGESNSIQNQKIFLEKDLSKIKTKVAFNLTKRQIICFAAALAMGLPLFFLLKDSAGTSMAAFAMIVVMLPCFLLAMYEKHGQPLEIVIKNVIQTKFIRPKERPYQTENFYAVIEKQRKLEKEVSAIVNGRTKNHDPRGKKSREA